VFSIDKIKKGAAVEVFLLVLTGVFLFSVMNDLVLLASIVGVVYGTCITYWIKIAIEIIKEKMDNEDDN